jgi:hypothetical protein
MPRGHTRFGAGYGTPTPEWQTGGTPAVFADAFDEWLVS